MNPAPGYDRFPFVQAGSSAADCACGTEEVFERLQPAFAGMRLACVECYPGVNVDELARLLQQHLEPALLIRSEECFKPAAEIERLLAPLLTDDPVFGRMNEIEIDDFLAPEKRDAARHCIEQNRRGLVVVLGTGASLIAPDFDCLVYADLVRWEIQRRQRANAVGNFGAANLTESPGLKYKRAFFVDWRAADRLKRRLFDRIDFLLDTNDEGMPKLISGDDFRSGLAIAVRRPFRVVPFFDPGPWGGQWMKDRFGLPPGQPNYAWCFDCVPEENSLLLGFGERRVEVPAIDVVFRHPAELLGEAVYRRFGAEFPIRFDLLDTMGGGNLSLQVHPRAEYIREHFGMSYTQDESYYILDCAPGAVVHLGLKEGVDRTAIERPLRLAQQDPGAPFPADRYVNAWPARKHDHFLIPAGTIHCSGRDNLVLEISATPYIFTFKLWDWGRLGLDGQPRPIHLDHGLNNIAWDRDTSWVRRELIGRVETVASGDGWREERTGLHELEFIDTRRHWFTAPVTHCTNGSVNVLNLVQGEAAVVESPARMFEPFVVHYAETFIVPAAVGSYTIRPASGNAAEHATIKASVRIAP